jgi:hypothetical protein
VAKGPNCGLQRLSRADRDLISASEQQQRQHDGFHVEPALQSSPDN